jgi:hypothetical protein
MDNDKNKDENIGRSKIIQETENVSSENIASSEPIIPEAEKTIASSEPQTIGAELQTENMEVHHHPQIHHKKRWKDYLFEFLMLFLAVTSGFYVENLREYYVENTRAKEYAQSLYDDLKVDTAIIQRTYDEKVWIEAKYDSLQKILLLPDLKPYNEIIYYGEKYLTINDLFTPQDVTYQQLRSSGNFRYIKNIKLYKNIASYYNLYSRYIQLEPGFIFVRKNELSDMESKMFNVQDLYSLYNTNGSNFYDGINRPGRKFEQVRTDKQSLNFLYVKVSEAKVQTNACKIFLVELKKESTDLINELKKEYRLD